MVSSGVGSSTCTLEKRRSKAASFSMYFWYSLRVVAPMTWISPRARAGLRMLAASIAPSEPPAPIRVWSSSMKRMTWPSAMTSSTMRFMRSSNSPRYLVPATRLPISSIMRRFLAISAGTSPDTMCWARPSARAVLPTPGSPTRTGLFFLRRLMICSMRWTSFSRPTTGSIWPCLAIWVRLRAKESKVGVLLGAVSLAFWVRACGLLWPIGILSIPMA